MKAFFKLFAVLFAVLSLASCLGIKTVELSERLIIEAIGIDVNDDGFLVTLQALDVGVSGSGGGNTKDERTNLYNFTDSTPGRAFVFAGTSEGLSPLYSHARVLIIGKRAAERDVGKLLDFFLREYTARSDILIAIAEDSAEDILRAKIAGGTAGAAVIERVLTEGHERGRNVLVPLYKFVNLLLSETDTAYCPVLGLQDAPEEERQDVTVSGTALLRGDRLLFANEETTEGILLLNGEAGAMPFSLTGSRGDYTLNTVGSGIKIKPSVSGGMAKFLIETTVFCDVTEYASDQFNGMGKEEIEEAERLLAEDIIKKEKRALEQLFDRNGMDVCRFGRRILLRYPEFYDNYIKDMSALTDFTWEVNASVRRTGRETLR